MSRESSRPRRVAQLLDEAWGISASQPERELNFGSSAPDAGSLPW